MLRALQADDVLKLMIRCRSRTAGMARAVVQRAATSYWLRMKAAAPWNMNSTEVTLPNLHECSA